MADDNNANGNSSGSGDSGADQGQQQGNQQGADQNGGQQQQGSQGQSGGDQGGQGSGQQQGQSGDQGQQGQQQAPRWPEDWRTQLAGGDDKALKRLERFGSPADIFKSFRQLEARMSSGQLKAAAPGKDATPEEVAAWRKEAGIPETADGYSLPKDLVGQIAEADQPKLKAFYEQAHKMNLPPDVANALLAYHAQTEQAAKAEADAQRKQADDAALNTCKEELIAEWGSLAEYRKNVAMVNSTFMGMFGEEDRTLLANARLADGTPLMSHPGILKGLTSVVREINPAATVVPNGGAGSLQSIETEIASLKGKMADRDSDYWKGPNAEKNQARYRDLISARDKMKTRAA